MPERHRPPRSEEIGDNVARMEREWEAQAEALATVQQFNAQLAAKKFAWLQLRRRSRCAAEFDRGIEVVDYRGIANCRITK